MRVGHGGAGRGDADPLLARQSKCQARRAKLQIAIIADRRKLKGLLIESPQARHGTGDDSNFGALHGIPRVLVDNCIEVQAGPDATDGGAQPTLSRINGAARGGLSILGPARKRSRKRLSSNRCAINFKRGGAQTESSG
jgi:hypothetical protein